MAQLVNAQTNQAEDVPQTNVVDALSSGKYNIQAGSQFNVVNPQGQLVSIPSEQVPDAVMKYGYQIPSQGQIDDFNNQQTYGKGIGNELKSAALGAGEGATFGLSDQALVKSGLVKPETIQNIEKYNPTSHMLGMGAGIVGSSALLPGGGLTGLAAKTGEAVGDTAADIGANAIANSVGQTGTAAKILDFANQVGAKALGSAVEGAAYGAGQSVTEDALGDPSLNGEKIMANLGYGALIGGALGGTLKAGELAVPAAYNSAKQAMSDLYSAAIGKPGEEPGFLTQKYAQLQAPASGVSPQDFLTAFKQRAQAIGTPEDLEKLQSQVTDNLELLKNNVKRTATQTIAEVRPDESAQLLKDIPSSQVLPEAQRIQQILQTSIDTMESKPSLYPARFITKLQDLKSDFEKSLTKPSEEFHAGSDYGPYFVNDNAQLQPTESGSASDVFKAINDLKQGLDTKIPWDKEVLSGESADALNELKGVRTQIKQSLENEDVWGQAAARQSAFNDAYSQYLKASKLFQKQFVYKPTGEINPTKVLSFIKQINLPQGDLRNQILQDYIQKSQNLLDEVENTYKSVPGEGYDRSEANDLFQRHQDLVNEAQKEADLQKTVKRVNTAHEHYSHVSNILEFGAIEHHPALFPIIEGARMVMAPGSAIGRLAMLERIFNGVTNTVGRAARSLFRGADSTLDATKGLITQDLIPSKKLARHQEMVAQINELYHNPQKLLDTLTTNNQELSNVAPKTATSLSSTMSAATAFLASKVPTGPSNNIMNEPYIPSKTEIDKFSRYFQAVEDPMSVMKQIKTGTITPEAIETLQTVYPKLYSAMQSEVMDALTSKLGQKTNNTVPYKTRLALSMFLGMDLDSSLKQINIAANQQLMGPAQPHPGPKINQKGLSSIDLASRIMTNQQQVSQRT